MLENNTIENFSVSPLRRNGGGASKISGKICCLRRNAFVDDPLEFMRDVIDSLASDYKETFEIEHGKILGNLVHFIMADLHIISI